MFTGGELPALVLIDAVARMREGVLGSARSALDESHAAGLLEYCQYTRPREWEGHAVPDVLLNGNHKAIAEYNRQDALRVTLRNRPEMLESAALTDKERATIEKVRLEPANGL